MDKGAIAPLPLEGGGAGVGVSETERVNVILNSKTTRRASASMNWA
jgi:hypothetical protein